MPIKSLLLTATTNLTIIVVDIIIIIIIIVVIVIIVVALSPLNLVLVINVLAFALLFKILSMCIGKDFRKCSCAAGVSALAEGAECACDGSGTGC